MKKSWFILFLLLPALTWGKVYDCFPFFNELDVLQIRLAELNDVVDFFVLVESYETFQGKPKPLYFEENKHLFAPYLDKIIHVVVERHPEFDIPGPREAYQRNAIERGLALAENSDVVLVSDCDEIPSAKFVRNTSEQIQKDRRRVFYARMHCFFFHLNRLIHSDHAGTVAGSAKMFFRLGGGEQFRECRRENSTKVGATEIRDGWHFCSIGGYEAFATKLNSYSHAEKIHEIDQIFNTYIHAGSILPINSFLPRYIQEHQAYFEEIGYIVHEL